jgi:hypothetical protein
MTRAVWGARGPRLAEIALFVAGMAAVSAHAATTLPLARPHDPVVVSTGELGGLTDRQSADYRMLVVRDGAMVPIPFQIDARDGKGAYELGDGTGAFDDDDELVFMAKDLGARATEQLEAAGPVVELEVADPDSGLQGWAYLVREPEGSRPDAAPYATYDAARSEVRAASYRLHYPPGRNFFSSMETTHAAIAGTLVSRMVMRIEPTFSLLFTHWSPSFTEDSFKTVIAGVRNGPVRAIVRAQQSLELGRLLPDAPSGDVLTFYYASSFVTPSRFDVPSPLLPILEDFHFEGMAVLDDTTARRYVDAAHPQGVELATGVQVEGSRDADWYVIDGPGGSYLHSLGIPEQWRRWGIRRATLLQRTADGHPAAGYSLRDMTRLREGGEYDLKVSMVVLEQPYRPGDEAPALAMLRRPLTVHARQIDGRVGSQAVGRASAPACAGPE